LSANFSCRRTILEIEVEPECQIRYGIYSGIALPKQGGNGGGKGGTPFRERTDSDGEALFSLAYSPASRSELVMEFIHDQTAKTGFSNHQYFTFCIYV
jgi:hypothetical protein